MNSNVTRILIGAFIAMVLLSGACSAGFLVGRVFELPDALAAEPPFAPEVGQAPSQEGTQASASKDRDELFAAFWQAWDLVQQEYVDQPVNDEELMRGAIQGMLDALGDEHTSYMDPQTNKEINAQLEGKYDGIGAVVDTTTPYLTIVSPYPDSPAEKAGLQAGDQIIGVDGEDVTGIDAELVRRRVIGKAGTVVKLTISREGEDQPFDVDITRATIELPAVESRMLEGNIAYLRVNYPFGSTSAEKVHTALEELMQEEPVGLILDLRYNGGGFLQSSIDIASEFIASGPILYERFGDGTEKVYESNGGGLATQIPLVVLINKGSASASEIVAGAIQDTGRGKLVGETSFGKGSVQMVTDLVDEQGAVRITVARWLTPNKRTIQGNGLVPDFEVALTAEDTNTDRDPQLEKAVELLMEK